MINISLLERSIPVAPIKIAALKSCAQLASQVDSHLVQFQRAGLSQPVRSEFPRLF